MSLLLSSLVSQAMLCGRLRTFGGTSSKIVPRGKLILPRGSDRIFSAEIDRAYLLTHCAQPVPCDHVAVCVPCVTMYMRVCEFFRLPRYILQA